MQLASGCVAFRGLPIRSSAPLLQSCGRRSFAPFVAHEKSSAATIQDEWFQNSESNIPEPPAVDPADKWKQITVEMWRDAVYTNQSYFGELISDTNEFVTKIAEHIKLGGRRASLVEVGCGTGEFVRAVENDFRNAVGVDFNEGFIDFCKEHTPARSSARSRYLQGDACHLNDLLKKAFPTKPQPGSRGVEFWDDSKVVACVGNTIGIIPEELRPKVYAEMAELAGNDGVLVMVYWNAKWFGDACLNFYHENPKLCGPFNGDSVDFKQTTLTTPMNYKTKWTSVEEARAVMHSLGLEIISCREKGKGVFVAARRRMVRRGKACLRLEKGKGVF